MRIRLRQLARNSTWVVTATMVSVSLYSWPLSSPGQVPQRHFPFHACPASQPTFARGERYRPLMPAAGCHETRSPFSIWSVPTLYTSMECPPITSHRSGKTRVNIIWITAIPWSYFLAGTKSDLPNGKKGMGKTPEDHIFRAVYFEKDVDQSSPIVRRIRRLRGRRSQVAR